MLSKIDNVWQKCSLVNSNAYLLFIYPVNIDAVNQPRCCCHSSRWLFFAMF